MNVLFNPSQTIPGLRFEADRKRQRLSWLGRFRYQLVGAILFGVILPALAWADFTFRWTHGGSMENTTLGTLGAILLGLIFLRRMGKYPGVQSFALVLPSFFTAYCLTVLAFFFLRIDYTRGQFILSFFAVIPWYFFVVTTERRVNRPKLLLLPFGNAPELVSIEHADWVVARASDQLQLPLYGDTDPDDDLVKPRGWSLDRIAAGVHGVVVDLRADIPTAWENFIATCALKGTPVYHSKQISESLTGRVQIEHLSENVLGALPSTLYNRLKRLADFAAAVVVMPFALLVMVVTAMAIKFDDGGKIFFTQPRTGFRGHRFKILKFRTMRQGAPGNQFTLDADPRITRIGHFLRRYRVDELPQIFNILAGDMSWIGPRPEAISLSQLYESRIPFYSYRHIVRPGITGWAQVNQGNVADIAPATEKLNYDFFYIKNFSPWLDLLICAKTVRVILTGYGSK